MGCIVPILRAGAALVLGVVLFVGFALLLVGGILSDKLLEADFYANIITAESAYNRIYVEVLVDDELEETTNKLLGNINVVSQHETVDLLMQIIPPKYLQEEVEGSIGRAISNLSQGSGEFDLYLNLTKLLESVQPVMFHYLDQKIDKVGLFDSDPMYCLVDGPPDPRLLEIAGDYMFLFTSMAEGEVPVSAPDLSGLAPLCRQLLFSIFYKRLMGSTDLSAEVINSLRAQYDGLKESFESGDALWVLKVAYRPLTESRIDGAILQIRRDLGDGDRLHLIRQLDEWYESFSEAQFRDGVSYWKERISNALNFGRVFGVTMVFGSAVLMGLVFFPTPSKMLIWPGIALVFTGLYFFVAGKIVENRALDTLAGLINNSTDNKLDVPSSVTQLLEDLLFSFGSEFAGGLVRPSLNLLILGVILVGASCLVVLISRSISVRK